jgi:hypothetical protein
MNSGWLKHQFWLVLLALACGHLFAQQNSSPQLAASQPLATAQLTQDQIRNLIRRAAERDIENDKQQRNYTYVERAEEHRLDSGGKLKSAESKTYDVLNIYGEQVRRLTAKDDKPLSTADAAREEEKLQKLIDKRENESDEGRKSRLEKEEKEREQDREFVKEIADAYNFRVTGTELIDGHSTLVVDADPRPGFEPHERDAKFLPKFRFRVWIDEKDEEWVKLDIQCIDTVSVGWFLASIHKGSNIQIEQTEVNHEVWLPKHVALKLDARLLFRGEKSNRM